MFRFFHKTRLKAFFEHQPVRYLTYAFGEVLLVVIGILIALQVNNWNEQRKDAERELKILLSLKDDIQANESELNATLQGIPFRLKQYTRHLSYVGLQPEDYTKEITNDIYDTGYRSTEIVQGTLNSVLSSDQLELIQNDTLKKLLTSYPASIEQFQKTETLVIDYVLDFQRPLLRDKYLSLSNILPNDPEFQHFRNHAQKDDVAGLLNDRSYQNILAGLYMVTKSQLENQGKILHQKTLAILHLLQSEIDQH